jgi:uncharacterized membrane protein
MKHLRSIDLVVVSAVTLLSFTVTIFGVDNTLVRATSGLPLVLLLPGYAALAALFPSRRFGAIERLVLSIGVSIAITILGGLLIHVTPWGLQHYSWVSLLGGLVLLGTAVAAVRRSDNFCLTMQSIRFKRVDAFVLGLALTVLVAGGAVAVYAAQYQYTPDYASLWMLPSEDVENSVRIGVRNGSWATTYRLRIRTGDETIREWSSLSLEEEERWEVTVSLPSEITEDNPVEALLYVEDHLVEPEFHVYWWFEGIKNADDISLSISFQWT